MRNEAPFILEWLAYHRTIGVTDFLIYSNDCEDGTDALLNRLEKLGVVVHYDNPRSGKKTVQWKALNRARNHTLTKQADWIMVSDVDEFLTIHTGAGHINDLIAACPDANGFAIDWRMFGSSGKTRFEDRLMMEQFVFAAPEVLLWPWRAVQFKSLYRNDPRYFRPGVHRPKPKKDVPLWQGWVNGSGEDIRNISGTVLPTTQPRYNLAQFNHYALGSIENFLVKANRGKPNHSDDPIDLGYWVDRNFNTVEDRRILRHRDAVKSQVDEWRKDPEIDHLHQQGVEWRKKRSQELLSQSDAFYTLARIRQMGGTKVLDLNEQKSLFNQLIRVRRLIMAEKAKSKDAG